MVTWGRFLLGTVLLLTACTAAGRAETSTNASVTAIPADGPATTSATGCTARVETGTLPDWADAGFTGDARAPHSIGARGEIAAVLFGDPLAQVRPDGSSNKILWVARPTTTSPATAASTTLEITATLDGTDTRVIRAVPGGPGPSIIDMPRAGCWHLDLRWAGRTDTMDLVYAERKP
ncbi:hypothetical protein [Micromonospora sp. NPDC049102]|uniref:hypothetical protein n=1 Tax=Micromonospora sp. NPDC049102 TaxID=3364265 RepID=UPI003720741C